MPQPAPQFAPPYGQVVLGANQPSDQQKVAATDAKPAEVVPSPKIPEVLSIPVSEETSTDESSASHGGEETDWDKADGIVGKIATFIHDHYYIVMMIYAVLVLFMVGFVMMAKPDEKCLPGASSNQMQVCEQSEHDWELSFREASKRKDAISYSRMESFETFQTLVSEVMPGAADEEDEPRTEVSDLMNLRFLFSHEDLEANKDSSIFTPKKVKAMCELEALMTSHPFYKHFCLRDDAGECAPQKFSISAKFYDADQMDPASGGCAELSAQELEEKADLLLADVDTNSFFFPIDATDGGFINTTRSILQLGAPLAGFADADDRFNEQIDRYAFLFAGSKCGPWPAECEDLCAAEKEYCEGSGIAEGTEVVGVEQLLFDRFSLEGFPASGQYEGAFTSPYAGANPVVELPEGNMAVGFWSIPLQQEEFVRVVNGDLNFAVFSIFVVGCYIWFHTGTAFFAAMSMMQIVLSLPVGFFFYYNIFQVRYYASVNILAIYLALGIGADSVFVLSDCWNQSRAKPHIKTIKGRLNYSISRTVTSCFNTTLTTVMSFVSTAMTPVVPIHCFAAFASLVLCVNYVFVCLISPTILLIHHIHFSDLGGCCCYCSKGSQGTCGPTGRCGAKEPRTKEVLTEQREKDWCFKMWYPRCFGKEEEGVTRLPSASAEDEQAQVNKLTYSEKFFNRRFAAIMTTKYGGHKLGAYACILCCFAYAIGMATQAFRLTPPTSEEEWFPKSHMFNAELMERMNENWKGSTDNSYMRLAFVFGIDSMDRSPHNRLFPAHDRGFVVYDPSFDITKESSQEFFISMCEDLEVAPCDVEACQPAGTLVRPSSEDDSKVVCVVRALRDHYRETTDETASVIPEDEFVTNALDFFASGDAAEQGARMMKYMPTLGISGSTLEDIKISWVAITVRLSAVLPMTNKMSHSLYDFIEGMTQEYVEKAPAEMKSLFQSDTMSSGQGWTWMDVEDALVQNLITGFTICFPVAFVVLMFATGNVVIAVFATCSIAFIVAGVLGAAKAYYAWDLGIAESIAGVIVIGFSVDYTVHLGHMYKEGSGSRDDKTRHALTYMGTTVIGGGLTTMCAGLVLFLCTLTFFTKMAVLLVWTIILSIMYALLFFMPLCAVFGPEGSFGEVPTIGQLVQKLIGLCSKDKEAQPAVA